MESIKHYGRTVSNKEATLVIKYLTFATPKQKLDILKLSHKEYLSQKEYNRLKQYIFKYKMYINSNSINVDSRRNKLYRNNLTYHNNKHI